MPFALFCILLIGHQVQAVVNKGTSQVAKEEEKLRTKADDRISNSFESPSDTYGPPLAAGDFKGPVPVYGPPELVGDHGPTPIYPPPPPELPPPIFGPPPTSYGPPKQSFGLPLLPKLTYGPPKLHYGLLKQHFTSPSASFALFRSPKPHYGPPLKLIGTPSQPLKPGHGPPIPISLETYGPPPPKLAIQFNPLPNDEYGPPPPPVSEPQPQYGPPAGDIYGPPPPAPPPGVPAPPTPPDIKYDGWQPIAGLPAPNQSPPTDAYGPPIDGKQNHIESSSSSGAQLSHASLNVSPHVPSDSYGAPIRNPEDQNLKTSVHESSASSENNGLPPPPLPQHEPLHNQGQVVVTGTTDHKSGRQQLSSQYGAPSNALTDLNGNFYFKQLENILLHHSESADGGETHALSNAGNSHDFQNLENDLSVQQLPLQKQPEDYNAPLLAINLDNSLSDGSLIPPPPLNTYGVPLSSYSPNGPYLPAAQSGRSPFPSFGNSFYKQGPHYHKLPGPFRPPPIPFSSLTPPQNREPIKFREPIPTRLLANIHKYLPPAKQQLPSVHAPVSFRHASGAGNSFASSFASAGSFNEQNSAIAAPHVQYGTPLSFTAFNTQTPHLTYGAPNFGPPTSFVSTSFGNNLYNGIDNVLTTTYGTPVVPFSISGGNNCDSSQSLNGALPSATGLPSSGVLHSSGELHLSGGLSSGGEVPSSGELSLSNGLLAYNGAQHSGDGMPQLDFKTTETGTVGNAENLSSSFANSLATSFAESDLSSLPLTKPMDNFLGGPPVNTLDLQHNEQEKTNLKDSYGNPVGLIYDSSNEASNSKLHTSVADVPNELSSSQSYSAEALTASLTAQGLSQGKNLESNEVDVNQFLKTNEGSEALSLARQLTSDGADGFEIQGSKGIYKLQIQPANGELNTQNSDGSIRHDQVLSNGLLQDILAVIEQPENGAIELQGAPQAQKLEKVFGPDLQRTDAAVNGHFITVDSQAQNNDLRERVEKADDDRRRNEKYLPSLPSVALFYNTKYATKEIRSVRPKSEKQSTRGDQQIDSRANLA